MLNLTQHVNMTLRILTRINMCSNVVVWLTKIDTEYRDRLKVIVLGGYYLRDLFKHMRNINFVLMFLQIALNVYITYIGNSLHFISFPLTFITILSLAVWTLVMLLILYSYGAKDFYCRSRRKIKECKENKFGYEDLAEYIKSERLIHGDCIHRVITRKYKIILQVIFQVTIQLIIFCLKP